MSGKIVASKFRIQIDQMIKEGKSSRQISSWLAEQGEYISHVTLATYRNSSGLLSDVDDLADDGPITTSSELAEAILKKAILHKDNAAVLRGYVDSYIKLFDRVKETKQPETQQSSYLKDEIELWRQGTIPKKLREMMINIFCLRHPYYQSAEICDSETYADFENWKNGVEKVLDGLFIGELPKTVNCKES